jgi:signal transduction histidine kinase
MTKRKRRIRNLIINPQAQFRYGAYLMGVSIVVHGLMTFFIVRIYSTLAATPANTEAIPPMILIGITTLIYVAIYAFWFLLGSLIPHRLYGPLVNINRAVEKLKDGDYAARVVLRKHDDEKLKELATSINALAERLEKSFVDRTTS